MDFLGEIRLMIEDYKKTIVELAEKPGIDDVDRWSRAVVGVETLQTLLKRLGVN